MSGGEIQIYEEIYSQILVAKSMHSVSHRHASRREPLEASGFVGEKGTLIKIGVEGVDSRIIGSEELKESAKSLKRSSRPRVDRSFLDPFTPDTHHPVIHPPCVSFSTFSTNRATKYFRRWWRSRTAPPYPLRIPRLHLWDGGLCLCGEK